MTNQIQHTNTALFCRANSVMMQACCQTEKRQSYSHKRQRTSTASALVTNGNLLLLLQSLEIIRKNSVTTKDGRLLGPQIFRRFVVEFH